MSENYSKTNVEIKGKGEATVVIKPSQKGANWFFILLGIAAVVLSLGYSVSEVILASNGGG